MKRITLLLILALTIMLAGCAENTPSESDGLNKKKLGEGALSSTHRLVDYEAGVVCWYRGSGYGGGMGCLPVNQTELGAN